MNLCKIIRSGVIGFLFLCGVENVMSEYIINLAWTPNSENVSHYCIYRSANNDSSFIMLATVAHPDTTFSDENVKANEHYYYVATVVSIEGLESGFSNVVDTLIMISRIEGLSAISGNVIDGKVTLCWSTTSEWNNYGFEVQRYNSESRIFEKIGFVEGHGTTSKINHYHFIDNDIHESQCTYRLKQIDTNGDFVYSESIHVNVQAAIEYQLKQNYPNPFNSSTQIRYSVADPGHVELILFDITGHEVTKLVDEFKNSGHYWVLWDGKNSEGYKVASGVYYYKLKTTEMTLLRKLNYVK
ncbi:T9SS type A sorting domain-containing protein [candidate division KSB1 bacterium]|nr:T9SS type A sorting domain-containing protein [candidate division KSB1 bacterium]